MKLKFSLSVIALLGLMSAMPTVGHANEPVSQPATRVLTEQEMQEVSGAGKACNTSYDCALRCKDLANGGSRNVTPVQMWTCGHSILPTSCPEAYYECGIRRVYSSDPSCELLYGSVKTTPQCATGCSGTVCAGGDYLD